MEFIKRYRYWIVLAALLLPIALRGLWFYHGFAFQPSQAMGPDYASNAIPRPPISTAAPDQLTATQGRVVVVDYMHGNQFTPNEIDGFLNALTRRGARLEIVSGDPPLGLRLKYASAYVVFSPISSYSNEEVNLIRDFVGQGGRLVVFTDPTRGMTGVDWYTGMLTNQPDADYVNALLAPYRISVRNDYLYNLVENEGNFRNILFGKLSRNAITGGLKQVVFYGAHSIYTEDGETLVTGDTNTYSSQTDSAGSGMAAAVLSADGNVLVVGDFSFMIPPYNTVADNALLIGHIADFTLSGTRTHTLADFPYVFDRDVSVVSTDGLQMTADVLGPFAGLQNALHASNTTLLIRATPPEDGDLLIVGLLAPGEELTPYIESFALGLDDSSAIEIPDFGTVARSGVGLLLYQHTEDRNILILLADTPEDLPAMINLLSSGDLSACVIQAGAGVCSVGSGGSYYGEPTMEATPEESPTPQG